MMRKVNDLPKGHHGFFISFEGVDGSGKTTQANMLSSHLIQNNFDVVTTHEPGGTRVGEKIREILLDPALQEMDPMTEAILYAADRAQHAREVLRPALNAGKVIICDRYIDSSLAYQGVARGLGLEGIRNLNEWATNDLYPNLTILIKIPFETGLKRLPYGQLDRMEMQDPSFHATVQEAYLTLAKFFSQRVIIINGEEKPEVIHHHVMEEVEKHL
jgi:dTMP kinase